MLGAIPRKQAVWPTIFAKWRPRHFASCLDYLVQGRALPPPVKNGGDLIKLAALPTARLNAEEVL